MKSVVLGFVVVVIIVFVGAIGSAGFWYMTENDRKDRAAAHEEALARKEREDAEAKEEMLRLRQEQEEAKRAREKALAKEDALRLFLAYIAREEARLKDEVEEGKINLAKIDIDQESISEELLAIEAANAERVKNAQKRGEKQRDKIERVSAILRSPVFNRVSLIYRGEDLAALRSKFEAEVQKIKDIDDRYQKRIKENIARYEQTVAGADEKVNKKLKIARDKYETVNKKMDKDRLPRLKKQLKDCEREIDKLSGKARKSNWEVRRLGDLQNQMMVLQTQLSQFEDVQGLSGADLAHMEATEAESEARRQFDLAGKNLTIDNDMALMERDYEQDIHNLATQFESASLDAIREAMVNARNIVGSNLSKSEKELMYIKASAENLELMDLEEINALRVKVAKRVSAAIYDEGK